MTDPQDTTARLKAQLKEALTCEGHSREDGSHYCSDCDEYPDVETIWPLIEAHLATLQSAHDRLKAEQDDAMKVLNPSMPESGLVDACRQVKQAAISWAGNCDTMEPDAKLGATVRLMREDIIDRRIIRHGDCHVDEFSESTCTATCILLTKLLAAIDASPTPEPTQEPT